MRATARACSSLVAALRVAALLEAALLVGATPGRAYADSSPPAAIPGNGYAIEVSQGPLLAPIHVTGVGGASVASAEDTEGAAVNAAAPAVRVPYSLNWFDYDLSAGASLPGAFSRTDFDNHGDFANLPSHAKAGDFVDVNVGATLQFGLLGTAATGDLQQFSLSTSNGETPGLTMQLGRWKALAAYGFWGGQLAVGGGARILSLQIRQDGGGTLLTMTGVAPEVGALLMPTGRAWRLGATVRAEVSGGVLGGDNVTVDPVTHVRRAGAFVLPESVVLPWEAEFGVAYQLGARPLNPGWPDPHAEEAWVRDQIAAARIDRARRRPRDSAAPEADAEERELRAREDERLATESARLHAARKARYANWPRDKILWLASVLIAGPTASGISVEGFLDQRVETVGRHVSVTPRFGLEGEPIPDQAIVRVGSYVEPSRYDGGSPRQHFTFGGDIRLFPFNPFGLLPDAVWKISMALDIAPRYTNSGIGIGLWH